MHARREPVRNVFKYPVLVLARRPRRAARARRGGCGSSRGTRPTSSASATRTTSRTTACRSRRRCSASSASTASTFRATRGSRCSTQLRVLGYVFNPVSFYWCYRPDGELACMIAELNNTFGERLPELLDGGSLTLRARQAPARLALLRARAPLPLRVLGARRDGPGARRGARRERRRCRCTPSSRAAGASSRTRAWRGPSSATRSCRRGSPRSSTGRRSGSGCKRVPFHHKPPSSRGRARVRA